MIEDPSGVDDASAEFRTSEDPAGADEPTQVPFDEAPGSRTQRKRGQHYRRRRKRGWKHQLGSWLAVLVIASGFALGLRTFVVQTFLVPSASMEPTLQPGDRILVLKTGYSIERGSIVVFRQPPRDYSDTNHEDLVKRVIGLPGETISSSATSVYIDGKPIAEPWLAKGTALGPTIWPPVKIPAGDYFMMGDNRSNSWDSRDWGVLPHSYIVGRVFLVIWRHGGPEFEDP